MDVALAEWQGQLERLLGITTVVTCEPGMGDNSRLSTHDRKLI